MKKNLKKDLKLRINFFKRELIFLILKMFSNNLKLTRLVRLNSFFTLSELSKHSEFTRTNNFCVLMGAKKAVNSFFNISRHILKIYFKKKLLPAIKYSSW